MLPLTKVKPVAAPQMKKDEIRIVLVDDNELLRAGIRSFIASGSGINITGEAKTKAEATDLIRRSSPDVILLNLDLKCGDALGMISDLLSACKTSRMAVLTSSKDPEVHRQVMSKGAIGVISNEDTPDSLRNAIKRVHAGGVWIDRFVAAKMIGDLSSGRQWQNHNSDEKKLSTLTDREREVVKLLGEGLKNKEIGKRLFISPVTVHHHLTTVYSKLEVKNRLELIVYAYKHHLAEVPR